jgi:hypothetical protein
LCETEKLGAKSGEKGRIFTENGVFLAFSLQKSSEKTTSFCDAPP